MKILAELKPDTFVSVDKRWLPFKKDVEALGPKLKIIPRTKINSTTRLINKILDRYKTRSGL